MLSDFTFVTHSFPKMPGITIYPIGDVHLGAAEHMEREWNDFCAAVSKEDNSYIILGGDLVDNATRNSIGNGVFTNTMRPREAKKRMTEMLMPLRDKILCAVSGNHERRSGKDADDDPMYDIMCKLDLEDVYRENMVFLRLRFGNNRTDGAKNPTYILCVTHGASNGALIGSAVNRASRFGTSIDGIDGLIVGHTHKPFDVPDCKIKVDSNTNTISFKPFIMVSVTSWLGYTGYAAQKMLSPVAYVPQKIILCGNKKCIETRSILSL